MGLGKIVLLGMTAASVVHAHGVLACELRRQARPVAEAPRKVVRIVEAERRVERPARAFAPIFSRRLILQ